MRHVVRKPRKPVSPAGIALTIYSPAQGYYPSLRERCKTRRNICHPRNRSAGLRTPHRYRHRTARAAPPPRAHGRSLAVLPRHLVALGDDVGDRDRRLAPLRAPQAAGVLPGPGLARGLERRPPAPRADHESGEQSLSPRARASGVELSPSPADQRGSEAAPSDPDSDAWRACVRPRVAADVG